MPDSAQTKVKISEGIRIGSQGRKQIKDAWFDKKDGACAIGTLMLLPNASGNVYKDFPTLTQVIDASGEPLINLIVEKNTHSNGFLEVIEWLESIGQ